MEMTGVSTQFDSLRFSAPECRRLAMALALSLAVHLLGWGGYEFGRTFNLWQRFHLPPLMLFTKIKPAQPLPESEPVVFVDVNPAQATAKAPKNARYFSTHNSQAANPETGRNKDVPQINGRQTDVPMVENAPRTQQPSPSELQAKPQVSPEQLAMNAGDLTLGKPLETRPEEQTQPRPRTVKQALAQQNQVPGVKMQENGGVPRHATIPSFDVKVTGFAEYDKRFIDAVRQRWYDLLDSQGFALDRRGKVVLRFHLNYDGSISGMTITENTVGYLYGYLCQKSVLDGVPYEHFPSDMRLKLGDYADAQFTFFY